VERSIAPPRFDPNADLLDLMIGNEEEHDVSLNDGVATKEGNRPSHWYLLLALVTVAGLAIDVTYVLLSKRHAVPVGDALYYHLQANSIAAGKGWFTWGPTDPTADHVPLWTLVLVVAAVIGLKSYFAQLLWACLVGAAAVFVTGLAAREVAGKRVGLIAAIIAAVYPNYWLNPGSGLTETLEQLIVAAVILVSFQLWHRPSFPKAVALGILCGLGALTRPELLLLLVAVVVPTTLVIRSSPRRRRLTLAGVGILAALVIMAPWVAFNMTRFSHPVILSTDFGATLRAANNGSTYYREKLGYWAFPSWDILPIKGDESAQSAQYLSVAWRYIEAHASRLPIVMAARVGREFGLYLPRDQIHIDRNEGRRPLVWSEVGFLMYYVMAVTSVFGAVRLRRRGVTLVPFVGLLIAVVLQAVLAYGMTLFRAPLEVGLVVLTAVVVERILPARRRAEPDTPQLVAVAG
jgi:4-amino-4-deoxy-L-arabinose transferase-like glycosyltransferase